MGRQFLSPKLFQVPKVNLQDLPSVPLRGTPFCCMPKGKQVQSEGLNWSAPPVSGCQQFPLLSQTTANHSVDRIGWPLLNPDFAECVNIPSMGGRKISGYLYKLASELEGIGAAQSALNFQSRRTSVTLKPWQRKWQTDDRRSVE